MAKRNRQTTSTTNAGRIADERGSGHGRTYKPWLLIQDVPSQGLSWRIQGWKTGREHHFLSSLEANYFHTLEWSEIVVDIREQYPLLPLEKTLEIAKECGYRHPADPITKEPVVMTTDFFIDVQRGPHLELHARTVKYSKSFSQRQKEARPSEPLTSRRTLEKLEIEQRFWKSRNIPWQIVTEQEIPRNLALNVEWLHPYRKLEGGLAPTLIKQVAPVLTAGVAAGTERLAALTSQCDEQLGLDAGVSLEVARHLLATRRWCVDMYQRIEPSKRLVLTAENISCEPDAAHKYGVDRQYAA